METERLNIRRFQQLDCNDLHDILGDAILMEFTEPPFSLSQTRDFLENFCIRRTPQVAFAVELKATQKVIGYLLLKPLDHKGTFELGFWINRDFWRTGIAFEACQCLIAHAFLNRSAQKIVAETCDVKKAVPLLKKIRTEDGSRHFVSNDRQSRTKTRYLLVKFRKIKKSIALFYFCQY